MKIVFIMYKFKYRATITIEKKKQREHGYRTVY